MLPAASLAIRLHHHLRRHTGCLARRAMSAGAGGRRTVRRALPGMSMRLAHSAGGVGGTRFGEWPITSLSQEQQESLVIKEASKAEISADRRLRPATVRIGVRTRPKARLPLDPPKGGKLPDAEVAQANGAQEPKVQPDWGCTVCGAINWARRNECRSCGAPRKATDAPYVPGGRTKTPGPRRRLKWPSLAAKRQRARPPGRERDSAAAAAVAADDKSKDDEISRLRARIAQLMAERPEEV